MGGYLAYTEYKDSGIEWLGDIPKAWEIAGLTKYLKTLVDYRGKTPEKTKEGVFLVTAKNIKNGIINYSLSQEYVDEDKYDEIMRRGKPEIGDVLLTTEAPLGEVANIDDTNIALAQRVIKMQGKPEILDNYFLKYWIMGSLFQQHLSSLCTGSTALGIKASKLCLLRVVLPSPMEQQQIAAFLDYKTAQIDALIAKKEALLEKLAEKRTVLISQAVTKGLDPTVPMKDSGIEWLGEIPEHWIASRLKHVTQLIIDGAHFTPTYVDEGVPFLRVTDIVQADTQEINLDNVKSIPEEEHKILSKRCRPEKGDLLYSKNGTIGVPRVIDWDFEFSIFVSLCLIKVDINRLNSDFLAYSLLGKVTENQISIGAKSNTVTNLHLDKIKEFWVCLPSLEEQIRIVDWLNNSTQELDASIQTVKRAIARLKEYRTALITNAVTGKIDVRDIRLPKPTQLEAA